MKTITHFYSRPCGRGDDQAEGFCAKMAVFLLTPLREGRLPRNQNKNQSNAISTHAPAGGATYRSEFL